MRVLVAIPHFFRARGDAAHYGSESSASARLSSLRSCIQGLHQNLDGHAQGLLHGPSASLHPTNDSLSHTVDVIVCTTGEHHLVEHLPDGLCEHVPTHAEPRLLGYECHEQLSSRSPQYDWYCYLEDDLLLSDPLFFDKLSWFDSWAPPGTLLQPNRFERYEAPRIRKVFVDGTPARTTLSAPFQDIREQPELKKSWLDSELVFRRPDNPHSGCFFLSRDHLERWRAAPGFLDRSSAFAGPLESAATLGIMRSFKVYKPAPRNASFLEIEHLDPRYRITETSSGEPRVSLRQRKRS